ncbi:MAG: alpha-amylase family glycosyl hydrolase [Actinomycetota bacterium]|nr:alpha-amylase family glycosyl hydrolase [Actinomycetota bacterium]
MGEPWWKSAVFYQVYPRSFADSNGDGVGDLEGIRRHLGYLRWLGIDAIWLSPFYVSPMADAGYDVADHCAVDPVFGSITDFDRLLTEAHDLEIRVLIDFVPNHTSDEHPWFVEASSSRDNPKRDWYIWRDEPNNWRASLNAGSAWTYHESTGQYYLHYFLEKQPDLNWTNPDVVDAMHQVLRFWLDRGVDGFRIDAVHCIGKDLTISHDPLSFQGIPKSDVNDEPYTHVVLRGIRQLVDSYPGERVTVGEVNIRDTTKVARYYGANDELHMCFNFPPLDAPWDQIVWKSVTDQVAEQLYPLDAWPTWVLSNHDNERHRTRYGGSLRRARAAAVLLLTLRGTPFLYEGEELGLEDAVITPETGVDPGGRDGTRAPVPWTAEPPHGWEGRQPWLPFPPNPERQNVQTLREDPDSILHLYRRLLKLRKDSLALTLGSWKGLNAGPQILGYSREHESQRRVVLVNFADHSNDAHVEGRWTIQLASDGKADGALFQGKIGPEQAIILAPTD